jgi:neopullulanase
MLIAAKILLCHRHRSFLIPSRIIMKTTAFLITFTLLFSVSLFAQNDSIYNDDPTQYLPLGMDVAEYKHLSAEGVKVDESRITPPFWWTGMANPSLEIMLYDQDIKMHEVSLSKKKGVVLKKVHRLQNPNYLFIEIELGQEAEAGKFDIVISKKGDKKKYAYELKTRKKDASKVQGINSSDFIYLIMPDRFANGDYSNDSFEDMLQSGIHRGKMYFRHGGDLQGIIDHLDYLQELGVTAIWLNPVLENDQPYASYHGYAITDHYKIDKRFGSNELYKILVEKCHEKGIKVVMDIIFNHCGHEHWLMKDLPSEDWVHQWPEFTRSNFRSSVVFDKYASKADTKQLFDGWFDYSMPDLNQQNLRLANYLIQNTIWWVEYSGHDAYRIDTWFYPDQTFLSLWAKRMQEEFPSLGLFGETYAQSPTVQASFAQNSKLTEPYNSNLPSITDFQLNFAIEEALTKPHTWTGGINRVYQTLAQDFLYEDPLRNVTFLDNHDKTRFFSAIGEDVDKFKSGIAFLLTMRGIPSLYYGTEILYSGISDPDGKVRQDFEGGWKEDKVNKFTKSGRTAAENDAFEYVKKLANYRKNTSALQNGKLTHFVPEDGIYVYFRYDDEKTIIVIMNTNQETKQVKTNRFAEFLTGFSKGKNIISEEVLSIFPTIEINKNTTLVLELMGR